MLKLIDYYLAFSAAEALYNVATEKSDPLTSVISFTAKTVLANIAQGAIRQITPAICPSRVNEKKFYNMCTGLTLCASHLLYYGISRNSTLLLTPPAIFTIYYVSRVIQMMNDPPPIVDEKDKALQNTLWEAVKQADKGIVEGFLNNPPAAYLLDTLFKDDLMEKEDLFRLRLLEKAIQVFIESNDPQREHAKEIVFMLIECNKSHLDMKEPLYGEPFLAHAAIAAGARQTPGMVDVIRKLIACGASINQVSFNGFTPLMLYQWHSLPNAQDRQQIVALLRGDDPNNNNAHSKPLPTLSLDEEDVFQRLLEENAPPSFSFYSIVDEKDKALQQELWEAVKRGDKDVVERFLTNDAFSYLLDTFFKDNLMDDDKEDQFQNKLLEKAISQIRHIENKHQRENAKQIVFMLIEYRKSRLDIYGFRFLAHAAIEASLYETPEMADVIRKLIACGALLTDDNMRFFTPLEYYRMFLLPDAENREIVTLLRGNDLNNNNDASDQ